MLAVRGATQDPLGLGLAFWIFGLMLLKLA